jgi:hypothetical protein
LFVEREMAIIVQCPYCGQGKVRAPESAIGLTVVCRFCSSCFTIAPESLLTAASATQLVEAAPSTAPTAAAARAETAFAELTGAPAPSPARSPGVAVVEPIVPPPSADPSFVPSLIALSLGGIALALSQIPYGRFGTAGFGVLGLVAGAVALALAHRRRGLAVAGTAISGLAVLFAFLLPEWLGMSAWIPARLPDESQTIRAVGLQDGLAEPAEWVDARKAAWQRDDVRVSVSAFTIAPAEIVGPKDKRQWTKEPCLQIRIKIENVGVARTFEARGWESPRLTDSSGKTLALKTFTEGWTPVTRPPQPKVLFPGRSLEQLLIFEAPGKNAGDLKLELPASAFGSTETVKFLLPRS